MTELPPNAYPDTVQPPSPPPKTAGGLDTNASIETISDITKRIAEMEDTERAMVAVSLLNVFNVAIVKLGGRRTWNHEDFMLYGTALTCLDAIRPTPVDYAGANGLDAVRRAVG